MRYLRVDDRLIHGQVVAGWARPLGIKTLILVSNKICDDEWACNAYRLAIPEGIDFFCVPLDRSHSVIDQQGDKEMMIIVETVQEAYKLLKIDHDIKQVNIGGLSYREGTREIAPYIHLSSEDIEAIVKLYRMGIQVFGKQLPNSSSIDIIKKLVGVT